MLLPRVPLSAEPPPPGITAYETPADRWLKRAQTTRQVSRGRPPSASRWPRSTASPHLRHNARPAPARARQQLRYGHVHDADPQVTALFRRRTRDNGTSGTRLLG